MRIKNITFVLLLVGSLALFGCNGNNSIDPQTSKEQEVEESSQSTESGGSFQTVDANNGGVPQPSFDEANILTFELSERDDSGDDIVASFRVKNCSDTPIDYFSADFIYRDADGNALCDDSRYNDFGVDQGKVTLMKTYSFLDDSFTKEQVQDIQVPSYTYQADGVTYQVDVESESVLTFKSEVSGETSFGDANVLSFEYTDKGMTSSGSYGVGVKVTNSGSTPISYTSIRMAYFDAEGNLIGVDGRFNDNSMGSGNFVSVDSYLFDEELSSSVGSYGIYSYEYRLPENDEKGFNQYEVNLRTETARGMHVDY